MLEQVTDLLADPFAMLRHLAGCARGRTSAAEPRLGGCQLFANPGHRTQYRFGQFLEDMKLAHLMWQIAENLGNWLWIQARTVGRDPLEFQTALFQQRLNPTEETLDVGVGGVVVENCIKDPPKGTVIDDRQHAERTIIQFIGCDVSREVSQHGVEIFFADMLLCFFPPRPPPSSGWWRRGQTRGGLSRDANSRRGKANRPPPPTELPA